MRFLVMIALLLLPAAAWADVASDPGDILLSRMDSAERDYHDQLFDYVMNNVPPGKDYAWQSYGASGSFRAEAPEKHNNTICRDFQEKMALQNGQSAGTNGIACKRVGDDGWCRLHKGDMHSCALEAPHTLLGRARREEQELLFQSQEAWRRTKNNAESEWGNWGDWWPF